jgi:glycerol-3-phosphate acyltransferase PlsY
MAFVNIIIALVVAAAYLLGSIPFGYLIAKIWNIDIRRYGSGNIGATNVFRVLGVYPGSAVFVLDLLKGTLAIYLARLVTSNPWLIVLAGLAAVAGHMFSVFLKFKGGRGAATGLGILLGIAPDIFILAAAVAALLMFLTRYVSVASMITPLLITAAFYLLKRPLPYAAASGVIAVLIIIRHLPNIKRLYNKTEPKIRGKK